MWTEVMGSFEITISSAEPVESAPPPMRALGDDDDDDDRPPPPPAAPKVYARLPLVAVPGCTSPPMSKLRFESGTEWAADGALCVIAGNAFRFALAVHDHVGNAIDGLDATWTYSFEALRAQGISTEGEGEGEGEGEAADAAGAAANAADAAANAAADAAGMRAPSPTVAEAAVFDPRQGARLRLDETGEHALHVLCDSTQVPVVRADGEVGATSTPPPVRVRVVPSALSPTHCTVHGSGLHSRWPDGADDSEREVVLIARDHLGNALTHSPRGLCDQFVVTLRPLSTGGGAQAAGGTQDGSAAAGDDDAPDATAEGGEAPPAGAPAEEASAPAEAADAPVDAASAAAGVEVTVSDQGDGTMRAVYPIPPLGVYALTVRLGSECLLAKEIVFGMASDRPKTAPHWSEEAEIFASQTSVALQRAESAQRQLLENAEAMQTARFQAQFKKKGDAAQEGRSSALAADEIFRLVDDDDSGSISADELRGHMKLRGYSEAEVQEALRVLDVDGDGNVSAEEFVSGLASGRVDPGLEDLLKPYEAPDSVFDALRESGGCEIQDPACRAITLRQLREVYLDQVVRRCAAEGWLGRRQDGATGRWGYTKLAADCVDLYDLATHVLAPATAPRQCAFVELVASGEQRPNWVVSAAWKLPLELLIRCLEAHARDHGLGEDCRYWIAAFAHRQAELEQRPIPIDPSASALYGALGRSHGLVSILDEAGECYSRVWLEYESYLALRSPAPRAKFELYTPFAHTFAAEDDGGYTEVRMAVGLVDGLACDAGGPLPAALETHAMKQRRERAFPLHLLQSGLRRDIVRADATRPVDRSRILNAIATGKARDKTPPTSSAQYAFANELLQGATAAMALTRMLELAASGGDAQWGVLLPFLQAVRHGHVRRVSVTLERLSAEAAERPLAALLEALDPTCLEELRLVSCASLVEAPPARLPELTKLRVLDLSGATELAVLQSSHLAPLTGLVELNLSDCRSLEVRRRRVDGTRHYI